jgi:pimeloyl-ACP methyl ester carboxylesterase
MKRLAVVLACLAVICVSASAAQKAADKAPPKTNVTGTWKAQVEVAGQTGEPVFTLKQEGEKITGKYKGSLGEQDVTGKVKDDEVEFKFSTDQGDVVYTGKIDNDSMKGTVKYTEALSGTWTAKREQAKAPAAGGSAEPDRIEKATGIEKATFQYATKDSKVLKLDRIIDTSVNVAGKRPVIIHSFGGGWEAGKRDDRIVVPFLNHFASLGYTVVSIDYRLGIKEAKAKKEITPANWGDLYLRAIRWGVEDLYDATSYVLEHAEEWNIDRRRIVILGESAGATNSLVAEFNVANDTELARQHLPAGFRYAGVISMAGAFWLEAGTPLTFKSKPAPIMFFHGAKDQLVTYDEVHGAFTGYGPVYFMRKFAGADYPKWFVDYPEGDHVLSMSPLIDNRHEVAAFLQKLVKERQQISVHMVEEGKVPKTFGNLLRLYGLQLFTGGNAATKN